MVYNGLGRLDPANWLDKAACAGVDTDIFYPESVQDREDNGMWVKPDSIPAKNICFNCRVVDKCLDFAIMTGEEYGVWGGMTPEERRAYERHLKSTDNGLGNSAVSMTVDSMLAKMDSGKPSLGRSKSRRTTSRSSREK